MSGTLEEATILPPDEPHRAAYANLVSLLESVGEDQADRSAGAKLVGPDGREIPLPDEAYEVLKRVFEAMSRGMGVTVQPSNAVLTTQQAADLLHVSRPTLVNLLEGGKIPYHTVGRHRRVYLEDLLEYEENAQAARRTALAELSYEAAHDGTADETNQIINTR